MDGVGQVSASGYGQARFLGADTSYSAVDPVTAGEMVNLEISQGSLADLGKDGVVVSRSAATQHRWTLGSVVPAESPDFSERSREVS